MFDTVDKSKSMSIGTRYWNSPILEWRFRTSLQERLCLSNVCRGAVMV